MHRRGVFRLGLYMSPAEVLAIPDDDDDDDSCLFFLTVKRISEQFYYGLIVLRSI